MLGCTGDSNHPYDLRQLTSFTLTSIKGYRDNMKDLNTDFKELIRQLRRKGLKFEFYAVPEYSPKNHLPHIHGIFRNENWDGKTVILIKFKELSDMWNEIHGAFRVRIESVKVMQDALAGYISKEVRHAFIDNSAVSKGIKHSVKEYPVTTKCGYRVHTSKGWLPENTELVHKILKKAANFSINNIFEADKKEIWKKIDKYFRFWAMGRATGIMRIRESEPFYIDGQKVIFIKGGVTSIELYGYDLGLLKIDIKIKNKDGIKNGNCN
jgi:hypothetical protein